MRISSVFQFSNLLLMIVGKFFEVLIGMRPEPLWRLLSKIGVLYACEPLFTIMFVTNMNTMWEKVMASVRGQVFRRVLIQKVFTDLPLSIVITFLSMTHHHIAVCLLH